MKRGSKVLAFEGQEPPGREKQQVKSEKESGVGNKVAGGREELCGP